MSPIMEFISSSIQLSGILGLAHVEASALDSCTCVRSFAAVAARSSLLSS